MDMHLKMTLGQNRGTHGNQTQQMKFSPAIASSVDEAASRSSSHRKSSLDERGLELVRSYFREQPGTNNRDLIDYLGTRGYSITGKDVDLARAILQTE